MVAGKGATLILQGTGDHVFVMPEGVRIQNFSPKEWLGAVGSGRPGLHPLINCEVPKLEDVFVDFSHRGLGGPHGFD